MNTHKHIMHWMILLGILTAGIGLAQTVTVTVETDKPVALAGQTQTAYLRIGLTGCPVELLGERAPVNVAIVIDKSGSMGGEKIVKAREAAILALHRLRSSDIVSIVLYDSDVQVLVPATKMSDKQTIIRKIRQIDAGGSTALYGGVRKGADEVRKFLSAEHVNRVVLISDGLANVGPDSPAALGELGAALVEDGISVTTIGLGTGYNEDLMSRLAYKSDGGHYFAETADELAGVFDDEFGRALSVVAQEVRIEIVCGEDMRPVRLLGRQGTIDGRTVSLDIQNIYSEHEKYAILEVEIPRQAVDKRRELALVRVAYQDMKSNTPATSSYACDMRFSDSQAAVEKAVNKRVLADAVEQIAIENNQRALALRDQGKAEAARRVLYDNAAYLRSNADKLESPKLSGYAGENETDAANLDEENWTVRRKAMRESQNVRQTQR